MIITDKIIETGRSSAGGWNIAQVRLFGFQTFKTGWKKSLIGKDFPDEVIQKFLSLKDTHLKNKNVDDEQLKIDL